MRIIILLIISLTITNVSLAQGTYTDELTGMTIDYPSGWSELHLDDQKALKHDLGSIIIVSKIIEEEKVEPEDFIALMEQASPFVTVLLGNMMGDNFEVMDYGLTYVGDIKSFYMTAAFDKDFLEDGIQKLKVKAIITGYRDYYNQLFILSTAANFDAHVSAAEGIIDSIEFPE